MSKVRTFLLSGLMGGIVGASVGTVTTHCNSQKKLDKEKKLSNKLLEFYRILIQWVALKQAGKNLAEYFEKNKYKTIAIYGMKELGERLFEELKNTGIDVKYAIDKQAEFLVSDVEIVVPGPNLKKVDAIVVTAINSFNDIENDLWEYVDCPIVSLEDVIYDLV